MLLQEPSRGQHGSQRAIERKPNKTASLDQFIGVFSDSVPSLPKVNLLKVSPKNKLH